MPRLDWTRRDGLRAIAVGIGTITAAFALFIYSASLVEPLIAPIPPVVVGVMLMAVELVGVVLTIAGLVGLTGRLDRSRDPAHLTFIRHE